MQQEKNFVVSWVSYHSHRMFPIARSQRRTRAAWTCGKMSKTEHRQAAGRKWGQAVTCYFLRANKEAVADKTSHGVYSRFFGSGSGVNRSSHSGRDISHVALRAEEPDGLRPEYGCILSALIRYKRRPPVSSSRELSSIF